MKERIAGVHHFAVSVPDIEVARRFYIDLLGAEEIAATEWEPGNAAIDAIVGLKGSAAKSFMARLKNTQVEVFEYTAPAAPPADARPPVNRHGYTHFGLQVDDVAAVYEKMVAAGIEFHAPPDLSTISVDETGRKTGFCATYGRDFFGNVFEIMEIHPNDYLEAI